MNKNIEKARIGKAYNSITNEVEYQLQFKMQGEKGYNGFSVDTFSEEGAKAAIEYHNNGKLVYVPFAKNGKFYLCKPNL